jgi:hypothetical protein
MSTKKAEQFFYKNAGYARRPGESAAKARRRAAKQYAAAEKWAEEKGYTFEWEEDPHGWDSLGDVDPSDVSEVLEVVMKDPKGAIVGSIGGVLMTGRLVADRDHGRIVEAELALEEMGSAGRGKRNPAPRRIAPKATSDRELKRRKNRLMNG